MDVRLELGNMLVLDGNLETITRLVKIISELQMVQTEYSDDYHYHRLVHSDAIDSPRIKINPVPSVCPIEWEALKTAYEHNKKAEESDE